MADWYERKYGPDPADVAEEKRQAITDDPPWADEWPDDEDSELVVLDEDDYEPPERELPGDEP